jgi:hypothetical protein
VLVSEGKVYASAGRSQGSDGGLVVRAYEAAGGRLLWSRALASCKVMNNYGFSRLNDIILRTGKSLQLNVARIDAATGKEDMANPIDRTSVNSRLKGLAPTEVFPIAGNLGFADGTWTRLMSRKYKGLSLGSLTGVQLSWNEKVACVVADPGTKVGLYSLEKLKPTGTTGEKDSIWQKTLPKGYQATTAILCRDAVIVAGNIHPQDQGEAHGKAFIRVLSLEDGSTRQERLFDKPLAYNGVVLASSRIYAAFADGSLACMGK